MSSLEKTFELTKRGSTVRQEIIAGLTTFLAMVYSVIVVPKMLGDAGFPAESVFIATCLVAGLGSILIGFWANAPMAIGCAISLTAFTAFSLVIGQHVSIPVALGAVFLMGLVFTLISATVKHCTRCGDRDRLILTFNRRKRRRLSGWQPSGFTS